MPEVCVVQRSLDTPGFIILASDGVWACVSSAEAIAFVERQLSLDHNPQTAAERLRAHVFSDKHGCDNVYVIIVLLAPIAALAASTPCVPMPISAMRCENRETPLTPPTNAPSPARADTGSGARRDGVQLPPPDLLPPYAQTCSGA
jgi:hypothetical protein